MTHQCLQQTRPASKKFSFKRKEQPHNFPLQVSFGLRQPLQTHWLNHFECDVCKRGLCDQCVLLPSVCWSQHHAPKLVFNEIDKKWSVHVGVWRGSWTGLRGLDRAGFLSSDTHFEKRQQRVMVNGMGDGGQTNLGSKATSAICWIDMTWDESLP